MDLYWQLEALAEQLIEQSVPHSIEMKTLEVDEGDENTPVELVVDAQGKEQQLTQLQLFCRTRINELSAAYQTQLMNRAPAVSIRYENDEYTEQYVVFIVNNEQAAKQITLRKFEKSIMELKVNSTDMIQQYEPFLNKFRYLFAKGLASLSEAM